MLLCGSFALHLRAADRGCRSAPGLPCALLDWRVERPDKARAKCAARTRRRVCKLKIDEKMVSCPGRSAALLQRCAAEPGPMSPSNPCRYLGTGSPEQRRALERVRGTGAM